MAGDTSSSITSSLLAWYAQNRRDLPWRHTQDPYAITVSEFLLHQTRVQTALSYYLRFLERFPDWSSLAGAPLDDVLKVWEGLGYYARAQHLHALAQRVCQEYGGKLPDSAETLRRLPGIGPYTVGAILSIAYGQDEIAVDGNVRRVLCRVFQVTVDPTGREGIRQLQSIAHQLLPHGQAGTFNQALMDLAAAICTPRHPTCPRCPLCQPCLARQLHLQESLPVRRPTKPVPHYDMTAAIIRCGDQILITKRLLRGLLGGLWEFPGGKCEPGENLEDCLAQNIRTGLAIEIRVGALFTVVEHAYTHFRITLHAFDCRHSAGMPQAIGCSEWKWVTSSQLQDYAFSAANHPIIAMLQTA